MKILAVSYVHPEIVAKLEEKHDLICNFETTPEELKSLIADRDMLIFRSGVKITAEVLALAPNLRYLIRAGSGLDNIDLDYVARHNLGFYRIPEPGARAVAEMTFGFMVALARQISEMDRATREGRWLKLSAEGYLLRNKMLGIVGVGNIGKQVARMGVAWDMKVIGCVEYPTPEKAAELAQHNIRLTDLDEVLEKSDFLALHVPLKDSTRNLIDEAALKKMKDGAFLINLARGGVVDEQALYNALANNELRGAALDVHAQEGEGKISKLADLPNVILTPHIGAQTIDTQYEIGQRILQILKEINQ